MDATNPIRCWYMSLNTEQKKKARESISNNLKVSLNTARSYVLGMRVIPASKVIAVEEITGVSRHSIAPDIYPTDEDQPERIAA